MSKVLVVGLDGATFDIIEPLIGRNRLPHLAAMMRHGTSGSLLSTVPPVSPVAWTSFFTGKNPGRHGIYGFEEIDPRTYRFSTVRTDLHAEKTLWQILGEAGLDCILWDVPFTYPPRPLRGWMLTGYGTPRESGTPFTYPPDLRDLVPPELRGELRVALPQARFDRSRRFVDEWRDIMEGRRRLLRWLIRERPWSLFLVVFSITDTMAHVFWTYADPGHPNYRRPEGEEFREALFGAYEMCDRILGELIEAAGPDATTLVLSDHGFGSVRPRQYIYRRLMRGGWIRPGGTGRLSPRAGMTRLATDLYLRFPFLREWVKGLRPGRRDAVRRGARRLGLIPNESIDFARSRIIPTSFGLQMWVNDTARFGHGCVPPGEVGSTLDALEEYLLEDRDPVGGGRVLARVHRGASLYAGELAARGPDLVIEHANRFDPGAPPSGANPYTEGGHTPRGIFLARGEEIGRSTANEACLVDATPTILHLLGQAVPPDMDGNVMEGIFTREFLEAHPVRRASGPARNRSSAAGNGYSSEEEAELREQFRRLGYID